MSDWLSTWLPPLRLHASGLILEFTFNGAISGPNIDAAKRIVVFPTFESFVILIELGRCLLIVPVTARPTNHRAYTELDCLARSGSPSTLSRLPATKDRDLFSRPALTSVTCGQRWVQSSGAVWKSRWPYGFCGRKAGNIESCTCIGHSLSLICQSNIRGH